jgi:hypothetical protein
MSNTKPQDQPAQQPQQQKTQQQKTRQQQGMKKQDTRSNIGNNHEQELPETRMTR